MTCDFHEDARPLKHILNHQRGGMFHPLRMISMRQAECQCSVLQGELLELRLPEMYVGGFSSCVGSNAQVVKLRQRRIACDVTCGNNLLSETESQNRNDFRVMKSDWLSKRSI